MKKIIFSGKFSLVIILASLGNTVSGQQFTMIDSLQEGAYGAAAWGDFDNDGFSDLVYLAQGFPDDFCKVYHNSGNVFTPVAQHFPVMYNPAARWADLDNDGNDDLVINGMDSVLRNRTVIFRSLGNGTFTKIPNTIFPLSAGSIDIADYDNDGWRDIAAAGFDSVGIGHAFIYRNLGGFVFTDINAPLLGIHFGEMKWGDYNNDSLADLVINGIGSTDYRTRLYRNMGNDVFELQPFYMKGAMGNVDWIDYDNDGFRDILVTGMDSTAGGVFSELHRNNGNGTFSLMATDLPAFGEPSGVATADFNNDGFVDVCYTGGSALFPDTYSAISMGEGGTSFTTGPFFQGNILSPLAEACDMDNDGDTDLFFNNMILRNDQLTGLDAGKAPDAGVTVFPNPGDGRIFISTQVPAEEIVITSCSGEIVRFVRSGLLLTELQPDGLESGLYLVRIRLAGDVTVNRKMVVVRK